MVIDRNGTFHIWKRPEMDLPEKDRFHMLEMEYSLKKINTKEKEKVEGDDKWGPGP